MDLEALKPALKAGMEKQLAEVDVIANNPEPPRFENTIVAMERAGQDLNRVFSYWGIWSGNLSSPEFRAIQGEMAPRLSEFGSKITQNNQLFSRIKAVYESDEMANRDATKQRLV
jgi:peptidyl-dipeptidase Dcp